MTDDSRAIDFRLRALMEWISDVTGDARVVLRRRSGGGRHEAWDVEGESGRRWFLRADSAPPGPNEHYTLRREAEIYRAVHATGVPSPAVLGVHPELEAVLLERVEGEAGFARLDTGSQSAIIADFAPWLARLHAADPRALGVSELGPVTTFDDAVRRELDIWESRLDATGVADPVLTACFIWLRDNVPATGNTPPSLVQGDTGPGNFLHNGWQVTAFLDFELAHLGDPMEDLAWVGTRNAQEPVPEFEQFLIHYAHAAGAQPDRDRIRYHALFAELRIAVLGTERSGSGTDLDAEHGNRLIYGALHRRLTVEALAAAIGVDLPTVVVPTLRDTDDTGYFDAILHQLRNRVGPEVADPYAARLLKGMARIVKYLREVDRAGLTHTVAELDGLQALLGHRPDTVSEGARELLARLRAREVDVVEIIPYAVGQVTRRTELVGPAMGVLATRHLPPI